MKLYEIREKVARMSTERKIVELFKIFPTTNDYFRLLKESLDIDSGPFFKLSWHMMGDLWITLRYKQCSLSKHYDCDNLPTPYIFDFISNTELPLESYHRLESNMLDKRQADIVCSATLPFIISRNMKRVPMIINSFNEFAVYALEKTTL